VKLITAVIREDMLDQVREALVVAGINRLTVSRVSGHGRRKVERVYRGQTVAPPLNPQVRLEMAVNEEFVRPACDAILESARGEENGPAGSGKIFVTPLEECIRIRTGETGAAAI
jgi:nitrogen regulatory protein P-II 1